MSDPVVHACPPNGAPYTPCCALPVFELPRRDRMTLDADLVTCWTSGDPRITSPVITGGSDE